ASFHEPPAGTCNAVVAWRASTEKHSDDGSRQRLVTRASRRDAARRTTHTGRTSVRWTMGSTRSRRGECHVTMLLTGDDRTLHDLAFAHERVAGMPAQLLPCVRRILKSPELVSVRCLCFE